MQFDDFKFFHFKFVESRFKLPMMSHFPLRNNIFHDLLDAST